MTPSELLVKCITLLYRESQLEDKQDDSKDLVRTALTMVKTPSRLMSPLSEHSIIDSLLNFTLEMCDNPSDIEYDKISFLQGLKLACGDDIGSYEALEQAIIPDMTSSDIKRLIVNIRRTLNNYFKEKTIGEILNKSSYEFTHKRHTIKSTNEFIDNLITQLEALELQRSLKDPAVVGELDVGDTSTLSEILTAVKDTVNGNGILKTGWQGINEMLQGGIRRGEFLLLSALQHNYKTGFSLSLFMQIALHNKPYMINKEKKPCLLRISFEDDLTTNLDFMYTYLKFNETNENVEIGDTSVEEMATYIKERLSVNGYHIKMLRVDPSDWTYKHIFNKIIELEAQGYEIHMVMVDYLSMIPTTGCMSTGPMGTDLRDMFTRIRNFCSPKKIAFVTPHQLSTEAKGLLRNGVPTELFVKEIAGKGYYERSKQLDQTVDVEVYLGLTCHKKKWYLAVQRGKHRGVRALDEEQKYLLLPFPTGKIRKMPILEDINREKPIYYREIPSESEPDNEIFDF
jgi:archaellum biogenesis ATPase FlaH